MARSVLEIILSLKGDKARKELKLIDKDLGKVEKSAQKSGQGIKDLGKDLLKTGVVIGGVAAGAVLAGKAIFEMGKSGAAVIQTGESFDFLLEKLDLAPDLLNQLRDASLGTVDDMMLMSGTATLLAGTTDELGKAMGDATPELMRIAKAANKLNPSLGDTAFMYQSIATGVKRAQPLILDNLGLTIKVGKANEDFAKSIGKTVEELTAEEKAMAILNATLEAGDLLIDQVGGNVESAADAYNMATAEAANFANELKAAVAPAIGQVTGAIAENLRENRLAGEEWDRLEAAVDRNIITMEEADQLFEDLMFGIKDTADVTEVLTEAQEGFDEAIEEVTSGLGYAKEAQRDYNWEMEVGVTATENIEEATRKYKQELSDLKLFIQGPLGKAYENFAEKQKDLGEQAEELRAKIAELGGEVYLTHEQEEQIGNLRAELGGVYQDILKLDEKIKNSELNKKQAEKAKKSLKELRSEAYELEQQILKLGGKPYLTTDQYKELQSLQEELGEVTTAIDENADAHDEATKRIMFNLLEQRASLVLTSDVSQEVKDSIIDNLNKVALEWGLLDQATFDYVTNADEYMKAVSATTGENMGFIELQLARVLGITQDSNAEFLTMRDRLAEIEGVHEIELRIKVTGDPMPSIPKGFKGAIPLQHGTSFTVPGGYPNDSFYFPMALSSGEHVQVTPRGLFDTSLAPTASQDRVISSFSKVYIRGGDINNTFVQNSAAWAAWVEQRHQVEFDDIDQVL